LVLRIARVALLPLRLADLLELELFRMRLQPRSQGERLLAEAHLFAVGCPQRGEVLEGKEEVQVPEKNTHQGVKVEGLDASPFVGDA